MLWEGYKVQHLRRTNCMIVFLQCVHYLICLYSVEVQNRFQLLIQLLLYEK